MSINSEDLEDLQQQVNIDEILKSQHRDNSLRSQVLDKDTYKQPIADALLQIRREKIPVENDDGDIEFQEYIRLEEPRGRWRRVDKISDEKWKELKKDGIMNEKGVQAVLGHLNAISNNNISLSNLTSDQIQKVGTDSEISLNQLLLTNMKEFEIEDQAHVDWIIDSVTRPNSMASLSQAKNGSLVGEILRETKLVGSLDDEDDEDGNPIPGM